MKINKLHFALNLNLTYLLIIKKKTLSKQLFNNYEVFARNYNSYAVNHSPSAYLFRICSL